jgi:hypothetical protein
MMVPVWCRGARCLMVSVTEFYTIGHLAGTITKITDTMITRFQ